MFLNTMTFLTQNHMRNYVYNRLNNHRKLSELFLILGDVFAIYSALKWLLLPFLLSFGQFNIGTMLSSNLKTSQFFWAQRNVVINQFSLFVFFALNFLPVSIIYKCSRLVSVCVASIIQCEGVECLPLFSVSVLQCHGHKIPPSDKKTNIRHAPGITHIF